MLMTLTSDPPEDKSQASTAREAENISDWDEYKPAPQWKSRAPKFRNKRKRSASAGNKNKRYISLRFQLNHKKTCAASITQKCIIEAFVIKSNLTGINPSPKENQPKRKQLLVEKQFNHLKRLH